MLKKYSFKNKQTRNHKYRESLRDNPTECEGILKELLDRLGIEYIFQKGFIKGGNHVIVDFYLPKPRKLCIEVDGGYHNNESQIKRDKNKEEYIKSRGFNLLRLSNDTVRIISLTALGELLDFYSKK